MVLVDERENFIQYEDNDDIKAYTCSKIFLKCFIVKAKNAPRNPRKFAKFGSVHY